jgi:type IV fimbrial biogenesis protein FimT
MRGTTLSKSATRSGTPRRAAAGFSLVELVMSICVMLVLTALAIPSLMRSLRTYQLNSAAASVSDMLKFTRFEAVRRNMQINFQLTSKGTDWIAWTDSFDVGNAGPIDARDKQVLIAGYATLLPAGAPVPSPNAITAAVGVSLFTLSAGNSSVTFDARGAVRSTWNGPLSTRAFVFYIGNGTSSDSGYRAVVLLPSGSTQIWTAPSGGPWRKIG